MDIRKRFFTKSVVRHCNSLTREVVMAPSLPEFREHLDLTQVPDSAHQGLRAKYTFLKAVLRVREFNIRACFLNRGLHLVSVLTETASDLLSFLHLTLTIC